MSIQKKLNPAVLGLALFLAAGAACADVVVIVSAKNPITALTGDQASDIFLGKSSNFPGGGAAVPLDLTEGSPVRDEFYTKGTGKSAAQVKAYWSKQIFTGKGHPPKELPGSSDVKKAVAGDANAIGYIEKSAVDGSVKVVLTP